MRASGLIGILVAGAAAGHASPATARPPRPIPARTQVPLGAALFYACADPAFGGPAPLACPVKAAPGESAAGLAQGYAAAFDAHFDRLTPENELKLTFTHPSVTQYDFSVADQVVAFAQRRGKHVRGHTLVYAASSPSWLTHPVVPWTAPTLTRVLDDVVDTEVGHFRTGFPGVVDEWDVVNEPFRDDGSRDPNVFQQTLGDGWIEHLFRRADAADPDAALFLNETAADTTNLRQAAVLALVTDFVARGVPIDGVGLQMHLGVDGTFPTLEQLQLVMAQYAALGLRVAVTEADALQPLVTGPTLQRQALDTVAEACRRATNCTGMTVWGVGDEYSWRGAAQHADLLDAALQPKPTYADVRCRLADPAPAAGAWVPKSCPGTPLGVVPQLPPSVAPAVPEGSDGASSHGRQAVLGERASGHRVAAHLKLTAVRRPGGRLRVTGTASGTGRVTVTFRSRAVSRTRAARLRGGRYAVTLALGSRLERVRRATLTVRYAGSAAARPAVRTRRLTL